MQEFITRNAWGDVWQRPGLDMKTRSLVTVALLAALGKQHELKGHVRGALNNGATAQEIQEVLLHASIYCGVPTAVDAFSHGRRGDRRAQEARLNGFTAPPAACAPGRRGGCVVLAHQAGAVDFHRAVADLQGLADFLGGQAFEQARGHFAFAPGQFGLDGALRAQVFKAPDARFVRGSRLSARPDTWHQNSSPLARFMMRLSA
jgi:alkylhydroperoxidase/carboxymuconolactone decarboxylase family protein YurZ